MQEIPERIPGQDFASCIKIFDSIYAHYSHLQAPKNKLEVQRTIEDLIIQINPFLLSNYAAKVFTSWAEDHSYGNQPLDIDTIKTIVDKLEQHPECQLTEAKRLPPHLSFINFGCPQIEEVPIAAAAFTNVSAPKPGRGRSNTGRDRSNSQSRRGNTSDQNPRSTDRNMENRSRDKNKNHRSQDRSKDQKSRERSKDQQRSNSRNSSAGSAYSKFKEHRFNAVPILPDSKTLFILQKQQEKHREKEDP